MTDNVRTDVPFITSPFHLAALAGQRYIVLRPSGGVAEAWRETRDRIRAPLVGEPIHSPNAAHVTMRFGPGTDVADIQAVARAWSREVHPLDLEIDRVTLFEEMRIIVVALRKTQALFDAYLRLRDITLEAGLPDWPGRISPDEWIFHMSVAYGRRLDDEQWQEAARAAMALELSHRRCMAGAAEIAVYDGGPEASGGRFEFRGR